MPFDRAPDEAQLLVEREAAEVYSYDPFRELALAAVIDIHIYDHRPASSRDLQGLVEIRHARSLSASHCAKRRADFEVEHQVGKIIEIGRLAIQYHHARPVLLRNGGERRGGIDYKR